MSALALAIFYRGHWRRDNRHGIEIAIGSLLSLVADGVVGADQSKCGRISGR